MNHSIMAIILSAAFLFSINAISQTERSPKMFVICKLGANVRTIQVNDLNGSFETVYSKGGESKVIGSGKNYESCLRFLENVKTNLEKSNWACKEATASVTE